MMTEEGLRCTRVGKPLLDTPQTPQESIGKCVFLGGEIFKNTTLRTNV